jgi:hypothetical protein
MEKIKIGIFEAKTNNLDINVRIIYKPKLITANIAICFGGVGSFLPPIYGLKGCFCQFNSESILVY